MYHDFTYEAVLASSLRAQWQLDDVLRTDQDLDFSRNFMPESLARTACLRSLNPDEQRTLNHISAHQYLWLFGVIEEIILPFVLDHARPQLREDDFRVRALVNFAGEEAKHIHLFRRFHEAFVRDFPVKCAMIGPPDHLAQVVFGKEPLAVALVVLMIEWMTQQHYLGSIKDDGAIDPLFKNLLKHHWMEEAQHAKLDTLMVDALAENRTEEDVQIATTQFLQVCFYLDGCLKVQAGLNIDTLERAIGRVLDNRSQLAAQQHRAARWTYIGTGMAHPRFKATMQAIAPNAAARVAGVLANIVAADRPAALPARSVTQSVATSA